MGYLIDVAVIDSSVTGLFLYHVDSDWNDEAIEEFLHSQGRHLSNCSWGVYDGEIIDLRDDIKQEDLDAITNMYNKNNNKNGNNKKE